MTSVLEKPERRTADARTAGKPERDVLTPLLLAGIAALLGAVGWPVLRQWGEAYTQSDSFYGYGPLVPLLVGLMLWHRRQALQAVPQKASYGAGLLLIPALGLLIVTAQKGLLAPASLSLLLVIWSSVWLLFGSRWLRAAAFPLGFLTWMSPLPGPILHEGTYSIQQFCTVAADKTLHVLTFPTTRDGNLIEMEHFTLFMDVPCSGMKLLLTLLMFGSAFAWLTDGPPRRRIGLFLLTLPLSIVVNVLRVTTLGIVGECCGAPAEHTIHDASALLTVALALILLLFLARRMGCRTFAGKPLF